MIQQIKPLWILYKKRKKNEDWKQYTFFNDSIRSLAEKYETFDLYTIPEVHCEVYKSIGGTLHLDQNYTVFGEVVRGLEVVDLIVAMQTNSLDQPVKDVRILRVRGLE